MAATSGTTDVSTPTEVTESEVLPACTVLFGRPNAQTGLSDDQCQPRCACRDDLGTDRVWQPPDYDEAFLAALTATAHANPYALLSEDPYANGMAPPTDTPETVCAIRWEPQDDLPGPPRYNLETFASAAAAAAAGATPTHFGGCGRCSTLDNLAVYIRYPDLTEPVRACGVLGITQGETANLECLQDLGFDPACAQIWYFNTVNTRTLCFEVCVAALDAPFHEPDGSLNACLQCDEDLSGPVFKAVAGRTRRNSGLANALCRPCNEVEPIEHNYGLRAD